MADSGVRAPDDLYALDRGEFIAARDALARELKAGGKVDEAAEVKRLRKPSVAAWALNVTARRHSEAVSGLLEAGEALRAAQDAALGGDAGKLRQAGRDVADAVGRVADLAVSRLPGGADAQRDRILTTLRAAATDEAGADLLRRGVLIEDLEPAGFGLGDGPVPAARPSKKASAGGSPEERERQERVATARAEVRQADAEVDAAERRAERARDKAARLAQRAEEAVHEAETARHEADAAEEEAASARHRARFAAARLADAESPSST